MSLAVRIDTAEPRILRDRIAMLISGAKDGRLQWDMAKSSGVCVDPVTFSAMLQPVQLAAAWSTSSAAPYQRLLKADYALATAASWVDKSYRFDGDNYLYALGVNEAATTHATFDRNRGFWFSYFPFALNDVVENLRIRMGNVGLSVYSDGSVQVYKPVASFSDYTSANLVGNGSIATMEGEHRSQDGRTQGATGANLAGVPTDLMVLPWRGRELLVLSSRGGGFSFAFEDIQADAIDPTITTAGTMAWYVPSGQAMVQAAPLRYATSGTLVSTVQYLPEAPEVGAAAPTGQVYWDKPGYGVQTTPTVSALNAAGTGAFVPDGVTGTARAQVTLTGDGFNSPWVYGASLIWAPTTQDTDDSEEADISGLIDQLSISVPESPSGVQVSMRLRNTDAALLLAAKIDTVGNRPLEIDMDGHTVFYGRTQDPSFDWRLNGAADSLEIDVRDDWCALERYQMLTPTPFDGRELDDVLTELARMPGYASALVDIGTYGLTLAPGCKASRGEWRLIPEAGDNPAEWLERLTKDYCDRAMVGWVPAAGGRTFRCQGAGTLSTTPAYRLYADNDTAYAALVAGGMSAADARQNAHRHVWRTMKEKVEAPNANTGRVWGFDPTIDRLIGCVWQDTPSRQPNTVPSARPDNWRGEPDRVSVFDPALSDQATVEYAAAVQRSRYLAQRRLAEMSCDLMMKADGMILWRGDCVQIANWGVYRVLTLNAQLKHDGRGWVWRPADYSLEYVAPEPPS